MNFLKKHKLLTFIALILLGIFFFGLINSYIINLSKDKVFTIENSPKSNVGLLLGAGVRGKTLSAILKDRADTIVELYQKKDIKKILVSGDNSTQDYNEVIPTRDYLIEQGIPAEDIFLDYAGFDTYDSLYRAKNIFGVKNVTIVTQKFHLYRSIYICSNLGLECSGVIADRHKYMYTARNNIRESFARIKAFLEISFGSSSKFLGEKIEINGESNAFEYDK